MRVRPFFVVATLPFLAAAGPPRFEMQELDPHAGNVVYAVTAADVNGDGRLDVCALTGEALVWYEAPLWTKHVVLEGKTEKDNVCFAAHDINRDGRLDFAIGAAWRPADTQGGGTLQWAEQKSDGDWVVHPIGAEPTVHRIRWGDLDGDGAKELIVAPLQGRGTKGPRWNEGQGVRLLSFSIPANPASDSWPVKVLDDTLHTTHNLHVLDALGKGRDSIYLAAWEGVFLYEPGDAEKPKRIQIGTGNQETTPFKGASEIRLGRLAGGAPYVATIEPWHGFQVVVYTPGEKDSLWTRRVVDEPVAWGHAVWTANLDEDADEELVIGQRDPNKEGTGRAKGPGVWVFDPKAGTSPVEFDRMNVDDGGMACEDATAADLNGDGRLDLIAGGRATHNVRIYWNQGRAR